MELNILVLGSLVDIWFEFLRKSFYYIVRYFFNKNLCERVWITFIKEKIDL